MVKPCDAELFLCTLQPQAAGLTPLACGYNKRRLQRQEVMRRIHTNSMINSSGPIRPVGLTI